MLNAGWTFGFEFHTACGTYDHTAEDYFARFFVFYFGDGPVAYAFLNNPVAAGLPFDILGAIFLISAELKHGATLERYWSEKCDEADRLAHLAERKRLPYHKRFPLWFMRWFGSKDVMDLNQKALEESLPKKFWAVCFLAIGFALQSLGSGSPFTARITLF